MSNDRFGVKEEIEAIIFRSDGAVETSDIQKPKNKIVDLIQEVLKQCKITRTTS
jgi:hypothetical protein